MIFTPDEPQRRFIAHLDKKPRALGFVGMGIGKTASCLAELVELFTSMEARAALVVAPLRVANLTWPLEVELFDQFRWMKVVSLRTAAGRKAFLEGTAHIYTMNYEFIPQFITLVHQREKWCYKHGVPFHLPYQVEIWDELTKAKNPSSKRIKLFTKKVERAQRRWGLTGTPAPNSELDLFAQVRLIDDGQRLGDKVTFFKHRFFNSNPYQFNKLSIKPGAASTIEGMIADITCTLRSSEWLRIPDTVVEDVEIAMPTELRRQYKDFEREAILQVKEDKHITAVNAGVLVNKLLQFTSGAIYDELGGVEHIHSLKVEKLREIKNRVKQPLLVACIFKHEQERLRKAFPDAKFFEDARNAASQTEMFKAWNAKQIPMLVCHPASAGHGLNLQHGGSHIVWTSLTYSREMYEQMIARLARRGQKEVTTVYRLMCDGTIDNVVAWALEEKAATERRLLDALIKLEGWGD
jgi:SNF2 family DNA or RNA helicase